MFNKFSNVFVTSSETENDTLTRKRIVTIRQNVTKIKTPIPPFLNKGGLKG